MVFDGIHGTCHPPLVVRPMTTQLEVTPTASSLPKSAPRPLVARGVLQLYTSLGRASFTPVMAQALRVAGQGTPVLVVQFLKGGISQGPKRAVTLGSSLTWVRCGIQRCVDTPHLEPEEQQALASLWQFASEAIVSGQYGLVVLDELGLAIKLGLIDEAAVIALLDSRPVSMDVIITGPEMPESLIERADLITQLRVR